MIDRKLLLGYCGGDEGLANSFIEMFKKEAAEVLAELPVLYAEGAFEELTNAAHKLKSHFNYLGTIELAELAFTIETLGREQNKTGLEQPVHYLEKDLRELLAEI